MIKTIIPALSLLVLSQTASAGLITDTSNSSFIDQTTGFEWMDFGVNNNDSYNTVISQLGAGGTYEGWRLASQDEVYDLWTNAFTGLGADSERNAGNLYGRNQVFDQDSADNTVLDSIFSMMGYNRLSYTYGASFLPVFESFGLFAVSDTNSYGYLSLKDQDYSRGSWSDSVIIGIGNGTALFDIAQERTSTMLIRDSGPLTSVPEPSSIAIMSLSLLGLIRFRSKKHKLKY